MITIAKSALTESQGRRRDRRSLTSNKARAVICMWFEVTSSFVSSAMEPPGRDRGLQSNCDSYHSTVYRVSSEARWCARHTCNRRIYLQLCSCTVSQGWRRPQRSPTALQFQDPLRTTLYNIYYILYSCFNNLFLFLLHTIYTTRWNHLNSFHTFIVFLHCSLLQRQHEVMRPTTECIYFK